MTLFFWISLGIIVYTFIGYGIILFSLVRIKKHFQKEQQPLDTRGIELPSCTVLIAAYNEEAIIRHKILNTLSLNYPPELLNIYIVADGSTDQTAKIIKDYPAVNLLYSPSRRGKVHAINRAMHYVDSEIVVYTDANTILNKDALVKICSHYSDPNVGGVAGEKRIFSDTEADASTAGESLYWKYESKLKQWDSDLNTTIGAAGELFSIRTNLYETVPNNTILDDFIISMRIAEKGYCVVYDPNAYAIETSSSNVNEELKRKIRIAAGGIQSIITLKSLFNPIKHPLLTFQFISHRVLRWTITPFLMIVVLIMSGVLAVETSILIYKVLLIGQILFYLIACLGLILEKKELRIRAAFVPYYFCMMNYAIIAGIIKYWKKEQSSVWDKASRKKHFEEAIVSLDIKDSPSRKPKHFTSLQ